MKNGLITLAGLLALLAVLGRFYAAPVLAQVRAALVQNVDEPGRNPFAVTASGNGIWTVPAGKRYVIETFSVSCDVSNTGSMTGAFLQASTGGVLVLAFAPAMYVDSNGFSFGRPVNRWQATGVTRLYADPGTTFVVVAQANSLQAGAVISSCSYWASGYGVSP